jgi:hypothetical protein
MAEGISLCRLFEMRLGERRQTLLAAGRPAHLTWGAEVVDFLTDRVILKHSHCPFYTGNEEP